MTDHDLAHEAERLISEGKMPSLADVVSAIRKTKGDPEFTAPVIYDALIRTEGKKQ